MHRAQKFFADRSLGQRKQQSFIHGIRRALGGRIKLPYGLDFVAEKLDAHRTLGFRRVHIENAAAQGVFSGHFDDIGGVVANRVEVRQQRVDVEQCRHGVRSAPGRRSTRPNAGEARWRQSAKPRKTLRRWQSSTAQPPAPPGSPGAETDSGRAAHRGWEARPRTPGSAAPVSSQKACSTGTRSSAARLSGTTTISGRPAAFCSKTKSKAFAVGISPETRIRPVPSFRWEATREKAGNFSTSVKRSRTKGRTMHLDFNRAGEQCGRERPARA